MLADLADMFRLIIQGDGSHTSEAQ